MGVSSRTRKKLNTRDESKIYDHCNQCEQVISLDDFKIIAKPDKQHLWTAESLLINKLKPELNGNLSAGRLYTV